ncbi:DUF305 domain-containing protein [Arthrobacter sp. B1805]|uniref:DUF305 domain-containing protein n=1 Tax=Arthrobacter sp. B1805 TaxID=2058892 RepID=UPI000CE32617|nr:DUF305 domain-containing protein [Arthrobacter sp. B1805]
MKRSLSVASLSVAALITLSACGSSSGGEMEDMDMGQESSAAATPTATTEPSTEAGTEASAGASSGASDEAMAGHNDTDVMFARMMIPHHQQAVEMSEMILAKDGVDPQVTDLATTIKDAQGPEIETMTGWLEVWGEPMEPEGGMEGNDMGDMGDMGGSGDMEGMEGMEGMDGMMSEDQMAALENAEGVEASRMFLESMTAHHEGAIDMAQDEVDNGQNPDAVELAETIVETQQAEIDQMQQLLATL